MLHINGRITESHLQLSNGRLVTMVDGFELESVTLCTLSEHSSCGGVRQPMIALSELGREYASLEVEELPF